MVNSRDLRISVLREQPPQPDGEWVVYCMTASRRLHHNYGLDRAVYWAKELGKPLLVFEALRAGYEWASPRHHRIVLDAMAEHAGELADQAVRYLPFVERKAGEGKGLLRKISSQASLIVTDHHPGFFYPRMLQAAAKQVECRLEAVDSVGLVPLQEAIGPLPSAYVWRRRMQKTLPGALDFRPLADPLAQDLPTPSELPAEWQELATPVEQLQREYKLESKCELANSTPVTDEHGGSQAALQTLQTFLDQDLERYDAVRMEARPASGLSMALHYGFLSPLEALLATLEASELPFAEFHAGIESRAQTGKGKRAGYWGLPEQTETFLDQLLTWRELGHRFQEQQPRAEHFDTLPGWAQETLHAHREDPRDPLYSHEQLERGETHDELWNAAQRCLVAEGWMPNYLRMLWGKQMLQWTQSPEQAWELLFDFNNRYALDGRDPNSMSGISWVFGRFDRPFGPERPISGKLRPMSSANTKRKMQLGDFVERWGSQPGLFV